MRSAGYRRHHVTLAGRAMHRVHKISVRLPRQARHRHRLDRTDAESMMSSDKKSDPKHTRIKVQDGVSPPPKAIVARPTTPPSAPPKTNKK